MRYHRKDIAMNIQPLARRTDPLSSYIAADKAKEFSGTHREMIMDCISLLYQATAAELAEETGLTVEQVDRRIHELIKAGMLTVAQCNGLDFIRDGFRVLEVPMSDSGRESLIAICAARIEVALHQRDTGRAGALNKLMTGLIRCRSEQQIKKMEVERGLL